MATIDPADVFLYHYTAVGTAEKIVRSRELWATNIYYLNDGSEFTHGLDLMRKCLQSSALTSRRAAAFLDDVDWPALASPDLTVFVVSFTEAPDLLSQWRSYCPPNRGISLGFRRGDLELSAASQGFQLVRCSYNLRQQQADVRRIARHWIAQHAAARTDGERAQVANLFASGFAHAAASYKNQSFREEKEWRLVAITSPDSVELKYREGSSTLIPYIKFKLPVDRKDRLAMRRIVIGPTSHWELAYAAVKNLIRTGNVLYGQIEPSSTPFRAW
jgi:hypothetical protein